ncbi:hypothetical protein GLAREA_12456 [Glarea lozoyensis ATCC 20868]|uniref:Uncharacterized protein n=1 Tax=Glarea lozoyensis (strain ATCC 20868 / MF5171) TaxID=1116229 RepID=S3D1K4_GLAL2|nr:uncharacterized protein GLAREA_12456 [Glarea lozoyensis ATCC 20868]EPE31700.1 hypothetical protein GLAREA_12456 [Glarea lozoyensis ATCC 20868]
MSYSNSTIPTSLIFDTTPTALEAQTSMFSLLAAAESLHHHRALGITHPIAPEDAERCDAQAWLVIAYLESLSEGERHEALRAYLQWEFPQDGFGVALRVLLELLGKLGGEVEEWFEIFYLVETGHEVEEGFELEEGEVEDEVAGAVLPIEWGPMGEEKREVEVGETMWRGPENEMEEMMWREAGNV